MFHFIALSLIFGSLWWWWRIDTRLRSARLPVIWRVILGLFVISMLFFPIAAGTLGHFFPAALPASGLVWHILVLPLTLGILAIIEMRQYLLRHSQPKPVNPSRRRLITAAAAATPMVITGALTGVSLWELGKFRVRAVELPVDNLPAELDGFAIALVADVHTGPFSTPQMLAEIVDKTNTIHRGGPADLVVLGGDLINTTLGDLPAALDMATALQSRLGTVACLGNHDVMEDTTQFVRRVEQAGIRVLVDQVTPLAGAPIQILGVNWQPDDAAHFQSVKYVAAKRDRSLFPICLAHHPHCWDEAARQGLPLVLSGHTHGGQIMLTKNIGGGPLKFRYWSGVHRRNGSTMVISNGVGNWFPLRLNAPAEILKITLRV
jgi:predicted MPP superfamily phosphohydrolase